MDYSNMRALAAVTLGAVAPVTRHDTRVALFECLIVSRGDARGDQFQQAAALRGWKATVCRDARVAAQVAERVRFRLVIVNLEAANGRAPAGYRQLAESLADTGDMLLVICGNDGDAVEEIWAHQLGAWLYLSGVDETCDLTMVCGEARDVVEKLNPEPALPIGSEAGREGR
jgi:ActR/RegA family two-component response regulator